MKFWLNFHFLNLLAAISIVASSEVKVNSEGRYEDLVIAIDESVPQDENLIKNIKRKFTAASQVLEAATRRKQSGGLSFKTIHILIPENWNMSSIRGAHWQRFDTADILVHHSTDMNDLPSTMQTEGCGQPGVYTRYTDYYFLNEDKLKDLKGPYNAPFKAKPEKMIVHQWAHYRWGVFDEFPTGLFQQPFYSARGQMEAVRCSSQIQGTSKRKDGTQCRKNDFKNLAKMSCHFTPDRNDSSRASLMFAPQNHNVIKFCDSNTGELDLDHNPDAPTQHNELCLGASVWEVMRRHSDFAQNYPTQQRSSSTVPHFNLVIQTRRKKDIVILADVSRSMVINNTLIALMSAATIFIQNVVVSETRLALVSFSQDAYVAKGLTPINHFLDQEQMISSVEFLYAESSTNIGAGLIKAFQVLGGDINNPQKYNGNGFIMLISDGFNNVNIPYSLDEAIEIIQNSSVTVDSISIGSRTEDRLKKLTSQTGGRYYMTYALKDSTSMIENFLSTLTEKTSSSKMRDNVFIISRGRLALNRQPKVIATIDKDSGQNTTFVFKLPTNYVVNIAVFSPSNVRYGRWTCKGGKLAADNMETYTIKIPGVAEPGEWRAQMRDPQKSRRKRSTHNQVNASYLIISRQKKTSNLSLKYVGNIDCGVIDQADKNTRCPCTMLITNHGKPIINARVTMVMTSPSGEQRDDVTFNMLDNGVGSDIAINDGVYTASIIGKDLTEVGIYNIRAEIEFKLKPEDKISIHRIVILGGLKVNAAFTTVTPDTTPPDQIRKLTVDVVNMKKRLVRVSFIAVGDDGDRGKASIYQFKLNNRIMNGAQFNIKPSDPGTQEKFLLQLDKISENINTSSFFLYVRAVDDENNEGKWSMGYPITFEKVKFVNTEVVSEVSSPKSYRVEGELMNCQDIIPPTWNYRCIVKVNVTDKDQPVDDARVTLIIIDPAGNKKMLSMNHHRTDQRGIYITSIIGRDFTIKGYYTIITNAIFYRDDNSQKKMKINESIQLGFLFCADNNPINQFDEFPPDQIQVISSRIINDNKKVLIKFVAVGDDGDRLKAKSYEFQVNGVVINEIHSNSTSTGQPGDVESIAVMVDHLIMKNSLLKLSVRARDHSGNVGKWSEPVLIRLKL